MNTALQLVTPICGKLKQMKTHAEHCLLLKPDKLGTNLLEETLQSHQLCVAQQANIENTPPSSGSPNQQLPCTCMPSGPPLKRAWTTLLSFGETQSLDAETQLKFNSDFFKLLIATGSPFLFANNPETCIFANKWMLPGAVIPDRKKLAGHILDNKVKLTEDQMKLKIQGRVGMGQCDGWKNKAKKSVVSMMVTVENEVRITLQSGCDNLVDYKSFT
jgi:hypothetical protein